MSGCQPAMQKIYSTMKVTMAMEEEPSPRSEVSGGVATVMQVFEAAVCRNPNQFRSRAKSSGVQLKMTQLNDDV